MGLPQTPEQIKKTVWPCYAAEGDRFVEEVYCFAVQC